MSEKEQNGYSPEPEENAAKGAEEQFEETQRLDVDDAEMHTAPLKNGGRPKRVCRRFCSALILPWGQSSFSTKVSLAGASCTSWAVSRDSQVKPGISSSSTTVT